MGMGAAGAIAASNPVTFTTGEGTLFQPQYSVGPQRAPNRPSQAAAPCSPPCPATPRQITADAERQFPVRITVRVPEEGFGQRYHTITAWLDENCGIRGWQIGPAGTRGVRNDAIAVYMSSPICAVAFVARWCVPGDPPGMYELRSSEPERRVPHPGHSSPPRDAG
jgi:hypothetical protein